MDLLIKAQTVVLTTHVLLIFNFIKLWIHHLLYYFITWYCRLLVHQKEFILHIFCFSDFQELYKRENSKILQWKWSKGHNGLSKSRRVVPVKGYMNPAEVETREHKREKSSLGSFFFLFFGASSSLSIFIGCSFFLLRCYFSLLGFL